MNETEASLAVERKLLEFTHIPSGAQVWRRVLSLGTRLKIPKDAELMHGGACGTSMYFVEQGEIRLMRTTADGREKMIMSMHAGSLTGETPFFDEAPSRSTLVAAMDTIVYAFPKELVLNELLPRNPDLVMALLRSLASKVRVLCNQSVSLTLEDLPSRICRFLYLRMRTHDEPRICPGLNQQELANLLGVHRVTLNKALRELEKHRILGPYGKDEVYVLDMERFERIGSGNDVFSALTA